MSKEDFKLSPDQERKLWDGPIGADSKQTGDLEYIAKNLPENLSVYKNEVLNLAQRMAEKNPDITTDVWLKKLDELVSGQKGKEQKVFQEFEQQLKGQVATMSAESAASTEKYSVEQKEREAKLQEEIAKIKEKFNEVALREYIKKNTPHGLRFALKVIWEAMTFLPGYISAERDRRKILELENKFCAAMNQEIDTLIQNFSQNEALKWKEWFGESSQNQNEHLELTLKRQQKRNEIIKKMREDFKAALDSLEKQAFGDAGAN